MKKWKIGWGITNKCNMLCDFCYSQLARLEEQEIEYKYLKKFIDNNYNYIDSINYGTGENTLERKWFDIVKYIKNNYPFIEQALTTNGYFAEILNKIEEKNAILQGLSEIDISLDFYQPALHNKFRGHKKAYEWAIESAKICNDNNIIPTFVIIGINQSFNKKNIFEIFSLAKNYNCFVRINIFRPKINQKLEKLNYNLLKNRLIDIIKNFQIVSLSDQLFSALILNEKFEDATGTSSLRILPNGSITPSTYLVDKYWQKYNIKNVSLNELLDFELHYNSIPEICESCKLKDKCKGGAIDRRIIWYGTLKERDPYCPFRNNDDLKSWSRINKYVKKIDGPSIHDGYLPTLIFKP